MGAEPSLYPWNKLLLIVVCDPFRYDLNQIPYDYTVEVRNRFKRLDLINRVPDELWTEVHEIVLEALISSSPRKINAKRKNGCLMRPYK